MLILTRRISEKLIVDGKTSVIVLGVKGNQVRLGIEAPKEIEIHREEIYQKILADLEQEKNQLTINSIQSKKPVISYAKRPQKTIQQDNECLV